MCVPKETQIETKFRIYITCAINTNGHQNANFRHAERTTWVTSNEGQLIFRCSGGVRDVGAENERRDRTFETRLLGM